MTLYRVTRTSTYVEEVVLRADGPLDAGKLAKERNLWHLVSTGQHFTSEPVYPND